MAMHKGKISRITPDYDYHPDVVKINTIDDIDKVKRNAVAPDRDRNSKLGFIIMVKIQESKRSR
jgi:hypothetical protein